MKSLGWHLPRIVDGLRAIEVARCKLCVDNRWLAVAGYSTGSLIPF